jgi:hypothetical protein
VITAIGIAAGLDSAPARAVLSFSDEFEVSGLGSDWTWENPGGSSLYTVSGGLLNMVVLPNNDQWSHVDRGARVLKPQRSASWTIETKRFTSDGNAASFGGLVVFKDSQNWLSLGWLQESTLEFSGIIGGRFSGPIGVSGWFEYLRLRKSGNCYFADGSNDGVNWTNVNMYTDNTGALAGARIGLLGKNWAALGPYSLSVEYFREYDEDLGAQPLARVSTRKVAQVTGAASSNRTERYNVCGADYGILFAWQGRTYMAFGDTRSCRPFADIRPDTLAFTSDIEPSDGLRIDGWVTDQRGEAKTLFVADGVAETVIPTSAIGIGDTAYIFYTNVTSWDMPPGAWSCSRSSIATATTRDPGGWSKHIDDISWASGGFNQVAVMRDPAPGSTMLYIFGTPCGRFGAVKLMTVDQSQILDKSAYRYFAGLDGFGFPVWSAEEAEAMTVAGGPAGEMSAAYSPYLQQYVLTYLDQPKEGIVMRQAPQPWGPWGPPTLIARHADFPFLYGPFMSPAFFKDNGRTFYYMLSQFGPYNTFLMETTLP